MARKAQTMKGSSRTRGGGIVETIKGELRSQIVSGQLPEGAPVPSEHELAAQFGVNRNHTRLALRDLALEGYILRARGRRSVVAPRPTEGQGRSLLYGGTTVALAQGECGTRFGHDIMSGFTSGAAQAGLQTVVYNLRFNDESELEFLKHVRELSLRGIALFLQHDTEQTRDLLSRFIEEGFPFVLVDRYLPELASDYVVTDNELLAYRLTKGLIERGHRRIALISDRLDFTSTRDRNAGYERALRESGVEPDGHFVARFDLYRDAGWSIVDSLMAYREGPTGFFCIHDSAARRLTSKLKRLGYRVPEHVEVAAVDDEHYAAEFGIPMITARQPSCEIGRQAAELLASRLKEPERPPERRVLPPIFAAEFVEEAAMAESDVAGQEGR